MNILPHKSWHVRTKKNIARVRRDEEQARQAEAERLRRVNLAEHEARIELLRAKSGGSGSKETPSAAAPADSETFNLFDNFKDKAGNDLEKDAEKKAEQEKWEVKTGIFSYLDGRYKHESANEWYLQTREQRLSHGEKQQQSSATMLKDDRLKQRHDPLEDIRRNLAQMKKREGDQECTQNRTAPKPSVFGIKREPLLESSPKRAKRKKRDKKSKNKNKHKHKSKRRRNNSSSSSDSHSASDSDNDRRSKEALIQRLRQERLAREKTERMRTQQLLEPVVGTSQQPPSQSAPVRTQKYNSQFNPHIARQNQSDNV